MEQTERLASPLQSGQAAEPPTRMAPHPATKTAMTTSEKAQNAGFTS